MRCFFSCVFSGNLLKIRITPSTELTLLASQDFVGGASPTTLQVQHARIKCAAGKQKTRWLEMLIFFFNCFLQEMLLSLKWLTQNDQYIGVDHDHLEMIVCVDIYDRVCQNERLCLEMLMFLLSSCFEFTFFQHDVLFLFILFIHDWSVGLKAKCQGFKFGWCNPPQFYAGGVAQTKLQIAI